MTIAEPTGSPTPDPTATPNAASFSDRGPIAPSFDPPAPRDLHEVLGIDWLSIDFPIEQPSMEVFDRDRTDRITDGWVRRSATVRFEVDGMAVVLNIRQRPDGTWWGYLRFNPARHVLNPEPWSGLPVAGLPAVLADVWWQLHDHVCPTVAMTEARVRRIDVARDFQVSEAAKVCLLPGLLTVRVPHATRRSLHTTRGIPQTVYASTAGEGGVRVYDHHVHHGTSPVGTLRVEAEAHDRWAMRYGGIEAVADISPSAVADLFINRWSWAGIGTPVLFEHHRTQRIWALAQDPAADLTRTQAIRLLGVERLQEAGITVPEGNSTRSARNALRAALGVTHAAPDAPALIRLDPHHDEPLMTAA